MPLAGREKSEISGSWRRSKPTTREKEQLGNLEGEEDEIKDLATERKKEHTCLRSAFEERDEHIACHASALVLAMTDEARREEEM